MIYSVSKDYMSVLEIGNGILKELSDSRHTAVKMKENMDTEDFDWSQIDPETKMYITLLE